MIFLAFSLFLLAATSLVIAERERRAADPAALPWAERVGRSAQRNLWVLFAALLAHLARVVRGLAAPNDLDFVVFGFVVYVLVALSAATFILPRDDRNA